MIESVLEKVGEKTGERVFAASLTPAFLFWIGGYLCWDYSQNWWASRQIGSFLAAKSDNEAISPWVYIVMGGFVLSWVLALSSAVVERMELPVLRWIEGYWPRWAGFIRDLLIRREQRKYEKRHERLQVLAGKLAGAGLSPSERDEYTRLQSDIRGYPSQPSLLMPTRVGNLLRAGERWPAAKYGLDAVICWPRLWLVLPEAVQKSLAAARNRLADANRTWIWSLLFLVWTVWTVWAALISIALLIFAYMAMIEAAQTFAVLIEAAFDVHRGALYKALRWPLPGNASAEPEAGEQITMYLWQGSRDAVIRFN